ncbi:ABC transporter permease [Microbacterium sp. XT11]|uniref:ABC transporter permease n=1 Tax=Microbacterium sp. XT11 TaxID=367477 RepID=UPI0007431204|nr:ABC transporter permease [Microbacterium sp. XT11]ALX66346.1 antibiotic ABC transporter permease [Microbacterium sp. XT11]
MNARRTLATAGRVLAQLRHDPRSIALMLIAPSLLVGLFAWLFSDQDGVFDRFGGAILALFPFIVMFLITSITTLRERRSGTLERLMTTTLGKADFILGYALAFGLMAVVQAVVTVSFAVGVCGLDVDGELWQLGVVAVIDALLGTALGLLASAFAQTEFQAVQFMPLLVFPQIILGGLFMPRDEMPDVLHAISDWLPLSYAIDAVNAVAEGDAGDDVLGPLLVVAAFAVGALVLASLTLRRRTAERRLHAFTTPEIRAGARRIRGGQAARSALSPEL